MDSSSQQVLSARQNIVELFSDNHFFYIPGYQRPFSWKADNFEDLIGDLKEAPRGKEYFLGTVVLHEISDQRLDIVDGQQRITSLVILLACIRDLLHKFGEDEDANVIQGTLYSKAVNLKRIPERALLTTRDYQAFHNSFYSLESTNNSVSGAAKLGDVESRYEAARTTFRAAMDGMTAAEIQELATFILNSCVVLVLSAKDFSDSFRLFEIVNDRGQQLRRVDILKSYKVSSEAIVDEHKRQRAAQTWEDCEERLGTDRFEQVFSLLRFIYTQSKPESDLNTEFKSRILGKNSNPKRGLEFVDALKDAVDIYEEVFLTKDYLKGEAEHASFKSLVHIMDQYLPTFEWRAVVLASVMKFGSTDLLRVLESVEKASVAQWVSGVRKDERFATYAKVLKSINSAGQSDMSWIDEIKFDEAAIRRACKQANFYRIGASKYLLCRAELASVDLDEEVLISAQSVEHVLPQSPKQGGAWTKSFTSAQRSQLTDCAGNLVLLSKGKNSSAGNCEFDEKKARYLKGKIAPYPRSMQVLSLGDWTPGVVRDRRDAFADLVLSTLSKDG